MEHIPQQMEVGTIIKDKVYFITHFALKEDYL